MKIIQYLCDGKACESCNNECKHTTDISHARNFIKRGDTYIERECLVVRVGEDDE